MKLIQQADNFNMKKEMSAGLIVFTMKNDELWYLLLHYQAGHWDFPKGHIDPGETKHEAALRELQEETGLQADIISDIEYKIEYYFRYPDRKELIHKIVYFFIARALTHKVTLSYEHIDSMWLPYKQAFAKLTYKNAKNILKKAHKQLASMGSYDTDVRG